MDEHRLLCAWAKRGLKKYERVTVRALANARHEFREFVQKLKRQKKLSGKLGGKRLRALMGEDEEEPILRADNDMAPVQDSVELPGKEPATAAADTTSKHQRTSASTRTRKPNSKRQREQPAETPFQGADEQDEFEAMMARTAESGIVAQKIR
jgi:hypothetical protein